MTTMCSLSCTMLSLLLILVSLQGSFASSTRRGGRLGSSLAAAAAVDQESTTLLESLLAQHEQKVAWGRLLEGEESGSMSMMPPAAGPSPTPRPPTPPPTTSRTMLALGDSLCAGQLPEPTQTIFASDEAYTNILYEYLQENYDFDSLEKLCCTGEDSYELINGGLENPPFTDGSKCYPNEEGVATQLDAAVAALSGNNDIGLITISIGANDVLNCGFAPDPEACVTTQLEGLVGNLQTILTTLTAASSTSLPPILAMTLYNPYLAFYLSDVPQEQALVDISIPLTVALQTVTTQVYNAFNVPVVSANDVFEGLDNSTLVDGIPVNVVNICRYTGMCDETETGYVLKSTELRDIHPTPEGYEVLGKAHFDVVDELLL